MSSAERVSSLTQEVAAKTAELHALQRELLVAQAEQRRMELRALSESSQAALGPHGLVVERGRPPDFAISRGFPTSRSDIRGELASPVELMGSVRTEPDVATLFKIPHRRTIVPEELSETGETGKGPALVQLFR